VTDWAEVAGRMAGEFATAAAEVDREGRFPSQQVVRLAEVGYLTMVLPPPHGTGADLADVCHAQMVLGRGCASTALAVNMHLFAAGSRAESARAGNEGHQPLLDRVGAGQIIGGNFTDTLARDGTTPVIAHPIDAGYVLVGRRPFCSLAPALDLYYGTARVEGTDKTIAFWLPRSTERLTFENTWDTMSMRGSGSWDVVFTNVFVPHLMAADIGALDHWDREAETTLAWFLCTIASVYLGIADAASSFVADRMVQQRSRSAASADASAVGRLGEVLVHIATARALLNDVLTRRTTSVPTEADLAVMKSEATNRCIAAVDGCVDLVGGAALYRRLPLERLYRDVRAARMHPPSDEKAKRLVAEEFLATRADAIASSPDGERP